MLRRFARPAFVLSLFALVPAAVSAQPTVSAELAYRSKYLFAGIPFASKDVQQAQVSVGLGSVTVYGFSVWDFDRSEITEADVYADYYLQASPLVGLFVGGALYNFDYGPEFGGWQGTQELYGGVVLGTLLSPTLLVAHDFDLGDGTHVLASVTHNLPVGDAGLSLDLGGNVDYNAEYYTTASGFSYGSVSAALNIPVGPLTLSPIAIIQRRLDDAFVDYVPDEEVFGVTASFTF